MKSIITMLLVFSLLFVTPAVVRAENYTSFGPAADRALNALSSALTEKQGTVWIYHEFNDTENCFTQKAKLFGLFEANFHDLDENWRENPVSGRSCIRVSQRIAEGDWGGWMFMNGYVPEGETEPKLNEGTAPGQGVDLTGATSLSFFARGEKGGERVEFFTCGFGYDGDTALVPYPDSCVKQTTTITLKKEWQEYTFDLSGLDLSSIANGFGFVMASAENRGGEQVFYLDDIRFTGDFSGRDAHYLLRSYDTDNIYIYNAAFTYDNAVTAMAFLSAGHEEEAAQLLDSIVYAVEKDRFSAGRVRNAYNAGDLVAAAGWEEIAGMPGWYDMEAKSWYEDRYQTGSNVGNTSYAALALLQYDALYENEKYLETARTLMDWVIDNCSDGRDGFTAGYDGWPEGGPDVTYPFTYKSIEHNIDAYAAFRQLYARTGEQRYADAAASALKLVSDMYDGERKLFMTGTLDDGVTPSPENIVLDAQVWSCMALGDEFTPYADCLGTVETMCLPEGGYPFCAANSNDGWWAEGTAYTALMYRMLGQDDRAADALNALVSIQAETGLFPAATVPNLSTGFGLFDGSPWEYGTAEHITPTAWFIMAVNNFNPYVFPGAE